MELYKASAAQGNVDANYNLALLYYNGHGVAQSIAEARRHFELASTHGQPKAPNQLQRLAHDYPLLGQRVVFVGLTRADFNGTRGTAIDFCDGRYVVQRDGPQGRSLGSGEAFRI